jgi:hypothetical protein
MKRFLLLCSMLILCASISRAQNKGFGLGIILGEPTGISGKYWLSNKTAIDGGLAWSFVNGTSFHLHGDHLWHVFDAIKAEQTTIPVYFGVGGRIKSGTKSAFGVRIPGGIAVLVTSVPLDVFLEIAPILDLAPSTGLSANGGIGVRFFFK